MLHNIVLLCVISTTLCLDLPDIMVEMFRNNVDFNTKPCENFYRHACPRDLNYDQTTSGKSEAIMEKYNIFKNLTSDEVYQRHYKEISDDDKLTFLNEHRELCNNDKEGTYKFHKKLHENVEKVNPEFCNSTCFENVIQKSCNSAGEHILEKLIELGSDSSYRNIFNEYLALRKGVYLLNAMKERNIMDRTEKSFVELVDSFKKIALEWMKETPWLINNSKNKDHERVLADVQVMRFQEMIDILEPVFRTIDTALEKCDQDFKDVPGVIPFICHLSVLSSLSHDILERHKPAISMNAYNHHPHLGFSAPLYLISQNSKYNSSMIGSVGFATAHELAHSIIVTSGERSGLTYFSQTAEDCIQAQYRQSCIFYEELSCNAEGKLEENGADVLGWRISYEYLKQTLGDELYENIPGLSITNQQMYFYSAIFSLCNEHPGFDYNKPHTAANARMNAVVQMPEFQEAFKCNDNSDMMQSRTEQCFVLGKNAPPRKIHRNPRQSA